MTFPLNVIIDGEEYLDGVTINQDELKEAMRANKNIKTSTPPMGKVVEYFEDLFDEFEIELDGEWVPFGIEETEE